MIFFDNAFNEDFNLNIYFQNPFQVDFFFATRDFVVLYFFYV